MQHIKIENQEDFRKLERLHYEAETKKNLLGYMISSQNIDAAKLENNDLYKSFAETLREYEDFKQNFDDQYVKPHYSDLDNAKYWVANFKEDEIIIYD